MKPKPRIAILGGGLSGLSFGAGLKEKGVPFLLFEANATAGGLARTMRTDNFFWDLGVHALYSRNEEILGRIHALPLDYQHCARKVKICHVRHKTIYPLDYPFENGLSGLPEEDLEDCLEGYRRAHERGRHVFANLRDWIDNGLGSGFSRVFMTPYNTKIWNAPLEDISMGLISGKIEPQPYEEILKNAREGGSVGRSYQAQFVYPRGGIQQLCDHFLALCGEGVRTNATVCRVEQQQDEFTIHCADGSREKGFTRVVSTIPLKRFCSMLPWPAVAEPVKKLRHNNTIFVLVGLKPGARFRAFGDCHWTFFAGDEVFYRLNMMHTFSDRFPQSCVAEYSVKDGEIPDLDRISEQVVTDLVRRKILDSIGDVLITDVHREDFTYPIPTLEASRIKTETRQFLADRGIDLLGRNGRWDYINMDHVLGQVSELLAEYA